MLKIANNLGEMVINWNVLDTLWFIILFLVGQILCFSILNIRSGDVICRSLILHTIISIQYIVQEYIRDIDPVHGKERW